MRSTRSPGSPTSSTAPTPALLEAEQQFREIEIVRRTSRMCLRWTAAGMLAIAVERDLAARRPSMTAPTTTQQVATLATA